MIKLQGMLKIITAMGFFGAIAFVMKRKLKLDKIITFPGIKHPIYLRPDSSDGDVFTQIFISKDYDIFIGITPETIIDAGANIGLASVFFKNQFPNAQIIAIEPDHENVEMIKRNLEKYDKIHIKEAALWPTLTQTRVSDKLGKGKWALIAEEFDNKDGYLTTDIVKTITIDEIMIEFKLTQIDLLKLDIESAEKELFSGDYMKWLPKTRILMVELHDWLKDGCASAFFKAINEAIGNYSYGQIGENIVIVNRNLVSKEELEKI